MAFNKQVSLLLVSFFLILSAASCRILRCGGRPLTTSAAGRGSVHDKKGRSVMGFEAFAASLGYLPKGVLVPPSQPSRRRDVEQRGEEADAGLAEFAGGI